MNYVEVVFDDVLEKVRFIEKHMKEDVVEDDSKKPGTDPKMAVLFISGCEPAGQDGPRR